MGATLNLETNYGRSQRGQRAVGPKPTAGGTRVSTVGGLSTEGLETVRGFDGTMNGDVLSSFSPSGYYPF